MRLAIVGSESLAGSEQAQRIIENALTRLRPTLVVSGGARGIDTMAVDTAKARGIQTLVFPPKERRWETGFKPRNILIAHNCDHLIRIIFRRTTTFGSGWTRDYAKSLGKTTEEFVI